MLIRPWKISSSELCSRGVKPKCAPPPRERENRRGVDGDLKAIDARAPAPEAVIEDGKPDPRARSGPVPFCCRLAMPCFGTVPHSTGRSCASGIEEQSADAVAKMSLGVCPR